MKRSLSLVLLLLFCALRAEAQVTKPEQQFGHVIGADYVLPNYQALGAYWKKLDAESDRMIVQSIGKTAEGRDQLMAIITSPANHARLAHYKDIARRLALADGLSEEQAHALASEGKAVVWIDGGLHATEVLGAQQLMETVYQLVSRNDPETLRILDDVIILAVHANPDGMDLVSDWYMRTADATKRSTAGLPRLYEKYAGHDNNRDSYMNALPESRNMSRIQFREWFPQIVYNHHQTGPTGSVLFAPPFRDPFNYNLDPLIPAQIDALGAAMHSRFIAENKPGAVTRRATGYSTWWNGGVRTAVYFHNMIGLLTESIGNPTPVEIPFVPKMQQPSSDVFMPIEPQKEWHFRQSIDYSITANYAVLDYASRYREELLYNIYRMGRNSIEKGSRDTWTPGAWDFDRVRAVAQRDSVTRYENTRKYFDDLRKPERRDARAYIIPSDQADFATATKFVNALIMSGISVQRARAPFTTNGHSYPAGSYAVKTAQAFRPHILDMFEPQQHPNDFQYPGGPPIPPYDNAGYTLAYQMGVKFDRILEAVDGPFETVNDVLPMPSGSVARAPRQGVYLFSHEMNDAFTAVNKLLSAGKDVFWLRQPLTSGKSKFAPGTFAVRNTPGLDATLNTLAQQTGVSFQAVGKVKGDAFQLHQPRVALWDNYGGVIGTGWIRYMLENFGFPYDVVYPPDIDAGNLRAKYDVIVIPSEAIGSSGGGGRSRDTLRDVPAEWRARQGRYTVDKSLPQLRAFLEQGGNVIAIGSATVLARDLGLPVETPRYKREDFYVPGSVLDIKVDTSQPLAAGLTEHTYAFFVEGPLFLPKDTTAVKSVAWYEKNPLRSGWAWGQDKLENARAVLETNVGSGKLFLFGPEITFRSQPHGTYKFLFNALYYGTATPVTLK